MAATVRGRGALAVGARGKRQGRAAGWTQERLAERAGYSVSYISQLERGERQPLPATAVLLAEALGLESEERAALEAAARGTPTPQIAPPADPPTSTHSPAPGGPRAALPVPSTPLIRREHEEAAVTHLLLQPDVRLLTLTGPPGICKT